LNTLENEREREKERDCVFKRPSSQSYVSKQDWLCGSHGVQVAVVASQCLASMLFKASQYSKIDLIRFLLRKNLFLFLPFKASCFLPNFQLPWKEVVVVLLSVAPLPIC